MDFIVGLRVGFFMTRWTIEGAKLAVDCADIGIIDVPIDEIGDFIRGLCRHLR